MTIEGDETRADLAAAIAFCRVAQLESILRSEKKSYAAEIDTLLDAWSKAPA